MAAFACKLYFGLAPCGEPASAAAADRQRRGRQRDQTIRACCRTIRLVDTAEAGALSRCARERDLADRQAPD
jgi:hypothetical protein